MFWQLYPMISIVFPHFILMRVSCLTRHLSGTFIPGLYAKEPNGSQILGVSVCYHWIILGNPQKTSVLRHIFLCMCYLFIRLCLQQACQYSQSFSQYSTSFLSVLENKLFISLHSGIEYSFKLAHWAREVKSWTQNFWWTLTQNFKMWDFTCLLQWYVERYDAKYLWSSYTYLYVELKVETSEWKVL